MAKKWTYANARGCTYGTMICTVCKKKITSGEFRVRETEEAYLPQHRACSSNDPNWAKLDADKQNYINGVKERLAAFIEFKKQWNVEIDDFDEEIESMQAMVEHYSECDCSE
jgi:hypothetical protein